MSKKTNTKTAVAPKEDEELLQQQTEEKEAKTEPVEETKSEAEEIKADKVNVYCGPSIRGVIRQYTTISGGIPELLKEFMQEHPIVGALIVPTERFAEVRSKLETAGTAEAILYKQIKAEL